MSSSAAKWHGLEFSTWHLICLYMSMLEPLNSLFGLQIVATPVPAYFSNKKRINWKSANIDQYMCMVTKSNEVVKAVHGCEHFFKLVFLCFAVAMKKKEKFIF